MKDEVSKFIITEDAKSLAKSVLEGDSLAADALVDWILENRNHRGYSVIKYVEELEDTLREINIIIQRATTEWQNPYGSWSNVMKKDITNIYTLVWKCIRHAKTLGRTGPQ